MNLKDFSEKMKSNKESVQLPYVFNECYAYLDIFY